MYFFLTIYIRLPLYALLLVMDIRDKPIAFLIAKYYDAL